MENSNFLDKKYADLAGSKPVERATVKARHDPERKFAPHSREERIQAYLDRIDKIVEDERGWELLKNKIVKEFVIDTEDEDTLAKIANGLYESEKRIAVEQGRGTDVERATQGDDVIEKYKEAVKEKRDIQERTLGAWLEYLEENDAHYPTWFRYFVVRNLEKMGTLDKEKGEYTKRTDYTIAPFPELNSEALGFTYRMLITGIGHQELTNNPEKRDELAKLIAKKDFIKLYTFAQIETAGQLNRESIQGEWVKYDQGSDHHIIEQDLRGKGTGWCTAEGSAYSHLQGGDFYVYFTRGTSGTYSEPRVAIRMEGDHVAEVRGVNHRQELEPALLDIATEKYHALPGGEKFDKKSEDMKLVTALVKKDEKGEQFTKDDLVFLYEIDDKIEGFGYEKDPRIAELRGKRNPKEDAPVVFDCTPSQIATNQNEITDQTKVYIGLLFANIFKKNIEHLYTSFPEGKIKTFETTIGGKTKEELEKELKQKNITVGTYAQQLLDSPDFTTSKNVEDIDLVRLTVEGLGFSNGATTDEIYKKAEEFGLELCPPEVGPQLRLSYSGDEYLRIAMKQITDRDGSPSVFSLSRGGAELFLDADGAKPSFRWSAGFMFVFRARKDA